MGRPQQLVLAALGVLLATMSLVGCGASQKSQTEPSPSPTGSLVAAEARYISDMERDASVLIDSMTPLARLMMEYPNVSASAEADVEDGMAALDALADGWDSRALPSARLATARDYWLQVLSHTMKAFALGIQGAMNGEMKVGKITAQVTRANKSLERLASEVDRLEAL